MKKVVERRLELLKLEGIGCSMCEIVKILSEKWHKTERTIYYDFETRTTWQPLFTQYFNMEKAALIILNRLDYIYRKASLEKDLRTMLDVTKYIAQFLGLETVKQTQNTEKADEEAQELLKKFDEWIEAKAYG